MATKKKTRVYHKPKMTIPLGIVAGFAPGVSDIWAHRGGGVEQMAAEGSRIYLGFAGTNNFGYNDTIGFHPYLLKYGTLPLAAGVLAHKLANKFGVNRMLKSAGIPFIRI
jgi:hypothetical protein